jgi:antirestriction protein
MMDTPKIYVADLEAYNSGRLVGKWFELDDYSSAEELMEAITEYMTSLGKEEYAIHDIENLPRSLYDEYMGKKDFEKIYEILDKAKEMDLPFEVVAEVAREYSIDADRKSVV